LITQAQNGHATPVDRRQIEQVVGVLKANQAAMNRYSPHAYPGRLLYFRAEERSTQRPEHFWVDLAGRGIEIQPVPGDHFTMNHQPYVQTIAEKLEIV
jgi:thioesterase domain-containing protein